MADISPWAFHKATGRRPTMLELIYANCPYPNAKGYKHYDCGWCPEHNNLRKVCRCINEADEVPCTLERNPIPLKDWQDDFTARMRPHLERFYVETSK